MGRRRLWRKVSQIPPSAYFKPAGIPLSSLEEVNLLIEEAEALRLKDLGSMRQEECARWMKISRTTFVRILDSGRGKVADAILNGKAIRIEGGNYEMALRRFKCQSGHEWDVPFETLIQSPPARCPSCETPRIAPVFPACGGRAVGGSTEAREVSCSRREGTIGYDPNHEGRVIQRKRREPWRK